MAYIPYIMCVAGSVSISTGASDRTCDRLAAEASERRDSEVGEW